MVAKVAELEGKVAGVEVSASFFLCVFVCVCVCGGERRGAGLSQLKQHAQEDHHLVTKRCGRCALAHCAGRCAGSQSLGLAEKPLPVPWASTDQLPLPALPCAPHPRAHAPLQHPPPL